MNCMRLHIIAAIKSNSETHVKTIIQADYTVYYIAIIK